MRNNTSGFRRLLRAMMAPLRPRVPFSPEAAGKGVWSYLTRAPKLQYKHYRVPASNLVGNVRCVMLSDLHLGSQADDEVRLARIVEDCVQGKPDFVLLPGDFVNMQPLAGGRIVPRRIAEILLPLSKSAPTFAVMGNHDAEYDVDEIQDCLRAIGVTCLNNQSASLETRGGLLFVAGVEDHSTGTPDIGRALRDVPPDSTVVVVAHDPVVFGEVPSSVVVTICGHTHGGQWRLPLLGPVVNASSAPLKWTHGHILEDGKSLVVSAGIGTSGLPWRLNCPPEVVWVTIVGSGL